jgi:putative mRNA 3-end processing factor
MELEFLGGAYEVGKSSVRANMCDVDVVFDSGLKLTDPPTYPLGVDRVDALFLSHSHLDHCGNIPALHRQNLMPVYATPVTFELSHMLQEDSIKIDKIKGYPLKYTQADIDRMMAGEIKVMEGKKYGFHKKLEYSLYDAGHIPGSCGILVEGGGKSVFYTGDTHSSDTRLLNSAKYPKHADVVITETTYGSRDHPDRREVEKEFLDNVEDTLARGGTALIPVFAIGRTQEVLLTLQELDCDIYLDGMGKRATQSMLRYPDSLRSYDRLQDAFDDTIWIKNRHHRKKICKQAVAVLTTAGMLEGGPVLDYLSHLHSDTNSSILLTGYQVEDTNGRLLIEQGYVEDEESGAKFQVDMQIAQYDFSAHSGRAELVRTIKKMNPEDVVLMHGDGESIESLKDEFGDIRVHTPKNGDKIRI